MRKILASIAMAGLATAGAAGIAVAEQYSDLPSEPNTSGRVGLGDTEQGYIYASGSLDGDVPEGDICAYGGAHEEQFTPAGDDEETCVAKSLGVDDDVKEDVAGIGYLRAGQHEGGGYVVGDGHQSNDAPLWGHIGVQSDGTAEGTGVVSSACQDDYTPGEDVATPEETAAYVLSGGVADCG